jgi:hypothetical protein
VVGISVMETQDREGSANGAAGLLHTAYCLLPEKPLWRVRMWPSGLRLARSVRRPSHGGSPEDSDWSVVLEAAEFPDRLCAVDGLSQTISSETVVPDSPKPAGQPRCMIQINHLHLT